MIKVIKESAFPAKLPSVYTENMYRQLAKDLEYELKNTPGANYKYVATPVDVLLTDVDLESTAAQIQIEHISNENMVFRVHFMRDGGSGPYCRTFGELIEVIKKGLDY